MSKIEINATTLAGNMGDGWADQNDAADGFSAFLESALLAEFTDLIEQGHQVEVTVETARNTSGCSPRTAIWIEGDDVSESDVQHRVEVVEQCSWDDWCNSEDAKQYFSE